MDVLAVAEASLPTNEDDNEQVEARTDGGAGPTENENKFQKAIAVWKGTAEDIH